MSQGLTPTAAIRSEKSIRYPNMLTLLVVATVLATLSYLRLRVLGVSPDAHEPFWPGVVLWQACYWPWAFAAPSIFWLERRFPLKRDRWWRSVAALFLPGLVISYLCFHWNIMMAMVLVRVFPGSSWHPHLIARPSLVDWAFLQSGYWAIVAAACVIRNMIQLYEQEQQTAKLALEKSKLEASLTRAELDTLRMRLKPHFLFNTLQNISVLVEQEPRTAKRMLASLGDLLRTAFQRDLQPEITLQEEIELTRRYLELEHMRFGDRLSIVIDVDPASILALVPSLLLQPLAENAIIHGLRGAGQKGEIAVRSFVNNDRLTLTVTDNGKGIPTGDLHQLDVGVGLGATSERLTRMYPDRHKLTIKPLPAGGTEVRIVIPLRWQPIPAPKADQYASASLVNR
jgi:two-component system, LytTR family, sensor kinase